MNDDRLNSLGIILNVESELAKLLKYKEVIEQLPPQKAHRMIF